MGSRRAWGPRFRCVLSGGRTREGVIRSGPDHPCVKVGGLTSLAHEKSRRQPEEPFFAAVSAALDQSSCRLRRYRFRLLVKAAREADLQAYLRLWLKEAPRPKGDVRLTIDIDPYSFL